MGIFCSLDKGLLLNFLFDEKHNRLHTNNIHYDVEIYCIMILLLNYIRNVNPL